MTPTPDRTRAALHAALPFLCLLICTAAFAAVASYLSYARLESFNSSIDDLGFYNQLFWITLHGGPSAWATYAQSSFDASYPWQTGTFILLVPAYAAFPSPVTLLVAQSIGISLATVPIYLLARKYGFSPWTAFTLGACYLLDFQLISVSLNDFHLQAFYPLTFFSMVLFYEYGWKKLFLVAGVISLATNPLTLVLTFAFLVAMLVRRSSPGFTWTKFARRIAASIRAPDALVVLAVIGVALGAFELWAGLVGAYHFGESTAQGSGPTYFSTVPGRLLYLALTFAPFLAAAFLVRETLVLMVPLVAFLALANYSFFQSYIGHQDLIEFLVVAVWGLLLFASQHRGRRVLETARRILPKRRARHVRPPGSSAPNLTVVAVVLVTAVCFVALAPVSPWNVDQKLVANINESPSNFLDVTPADHFLTSAMELIPSNASVLTQNNVPQLTGRYHFQWAFPGKSAPNLSNVDYILSDQSTNHFAQFWYSYLRPYVESGLASGQFGIVAIGYGDLLLERGYHGPPELEGPLAYPASDMALAAGYWQGSIAVHPPGFSPIFWYGPYVDLPAGNYSATFRLMIGPGAPSYALAIILAVSNDTSGGLPIYASEPITAGQFPAPEVWTDFTMNFTLKQFVASAEFPGLDSTDLATLYFGGVTVTVAPDFST